LRIIAGRWKGKPLLSLKGITTRPTSDRVKESVFNIIQSYVPDSMVLDLFAGTGSLGLEALSRGCKRVIFVERDPRAMEILNKNRTSLEYCGKSEVIRRDVLSAIKGFSGSKKFDIIFADPPYDIGLAIPVLEAISTEDVLNEKGVIVLEHHAGEIQPEQIGSLKKIQARKYGNTCISFYKRSE
jgi:16S rRNA (guanine966-N2)-methyltransferase